MREPAFRKLWSAVALFNLGLCLTLFLRTTGLPLLVPFPVLAGASPHATAVLGFPVALFTCGLTLLLTGVFARQHPPRGLEYRLPIPYFDPQDFVPGSTGARIGSRVVEGLSIPLPVFLLLPILAKIVDGSVTLGSPTPRTPYDVLFQGWRDHFFPSRSIHWNAWFRGDYRLDGPTFYPVVQPWLYLVLLLALGFGLVYVERLLHQATSSPAASNGLRPRGSALREGAGSGTETAPKP